MKHSQRQQKRIVGNTVPQMWPLRRVPPDVWLWRYLQRVLLCTHLPGLQRAAGICSKEGRRKREGEIVRNVVRLFSVTQSTM